MRTILLCGMLCALVGVGWVIAADDKPCQKPNPSTKFCFKPKEGTEVSSCVGLPGADCVGFARYSINRFPDGVIKTAEGATTESKEPCFQQTKCRQDEDDPSLCEEAPTLPWQPGDKIVTDNTVKCPTE